MKYDIDTLEMVLHDYERAKGKKHGWKSLEAYIRDAISEAKAPMCMNCRFFIDQICENTTQPTSHGSTCDKFQWEKNKSPPVKRD